MSRLEEISEYINQLSFDVKAEMLAAILAEQSLDLTEILASFEGPFKRVWARDIAWTDVIRFETGEKMLCLHLNRDGIYDLLPEGLFHSNSDKADQTGPEMSKDSMKLRAEEKNTRLFFQPFENEIFLKRVQLLLKENQIFKSIYKEFLMGIMPFVWEVGEGFPENYVLRLKKLLPLLYMTTGNLNLTAQCLEFIISEKVRIFTAENKNRSFESGILSVSGIVGKSLLGIDTIAGDNVIDFFDHLRVSIGPITNQETNEIIKEGMMNRFLDCFYSFFIPFEFDVDTEYIFGEGKNQLIINDETESEISYLGYNSVIQ